MRRYRNAAGWSEGTHVFGGIFSSPPGGTSDQWLEARAAKIIRDLLTGRYTDDALREFEELTQEANWRYRTGR